MIRNLATRFYSRLNLEMADKIASGVISTCKRNGFAPVAVQILNPSGNVIVLKTMDDCPEVAFREFSYSKAYTCLGTNNSSRVFRDKYTSEDSSAKFCQMTSMVNITGGKMAPFPGGVLLKSEGKVIGAIGVSGASGDEDEYCALQGV